MKIDEEKFCGQLYGHGAMLSNATAMVMDLTAVPTIEIGFVSLEDAIEAEANTSPHICYEIPATTSAEEILNGDSPKESDVEMNPGQN